ncbi:hypothetical protein [Clostridium sp.]|uniref:hypothetical protein n=1 Tax=Clostridium sp. TaxID=1506 RepID=UPI0039952979
MITNTLKKGIVDYILSSSYKASYKLNGEYKEVELLSKNKLENGLTIYINFGSIVGNITDIKIIDNKGNALIIDDRTFEKTAIDVLVTSIVIENIEGVISSVI